MPLTETMSVLWVLVMTKKSFMAIEKALGRSWRESLEESMKEAAEEEKRSAIERGSLHEEVAELLSSFMGVEQTHTQTFI